MYICIYSYINECMYYEYNYVNLCKKKEKKNVFHRTDGRTDGRSTQNYSSEPHKILN